MRRLETFTCYFIGEDNREEHFPNKAAAMARAAGYVGNWSYAKPLKNDEVYLFGPGDGTTSVMVRQDVDFGLEKGALAE